VNSFDEADVMWALATRFRADIDPLPGTKFDRLSRPPMTRV
jgi:hypothetical protein